MDSLLIKFRPVKMTGADNNYWRRHSGALDSKSP